jgi:hypothetical protein
MMLEIPHPDPDKRILKIPSKALPKAAIRDHNGL